jgi:GxxExxY protein
MDLESKSDRHAIGPSKLILGAETEKIIGFAFDVLNELGSGLNEKIYENSLVVLLRMHRIEFNHQRRFPVVFRGVEVGLFVPDLIVFGSVIVDAKVIERISDHERGQVLNYLRITKVRVGLILNFRYARLQWERLVL